jgi:hypothetical protein
MTGIRPVVTVKREKSKKKTRASSQDYNKSSLDYSEAI